MPADVDLVIGYKHINFSNNQVKALDPSSNAPPLENLHPL